MADLDLVTLGEAMMVVRGADVGPLRPGFAARLSFAGAEATVAIGMSRLGHRAAWCGRLGTDPAGDMILGGLRGEGVDVAAVRREPDVPTGLLMRHQRVAGRTTVTYYRHGQAGSRLAPGDLPASLLGSARLLHVTGITPALGDTAARAVTAAVRLAKEAGVTVSFDVNYRARLWPPERARPVLAGLAARADLVFAGPEEAALLTGAAPPEELAARLLSLGPREVVVKLGRGGALSAREGSLEHAAALDVTEIDPVGAGDAFVAGYLSAHLDGLAPAAALERANICGAFGVASDGDWEGLPSRAEFGLVRPGDNVAR